jgi:hypothetical protein
MVGTLYEKTSAEVLINPAAKLGSSGPCDRKEVFHLGVTTWGDSKNLSHIFITRMTRERLYYF